MSDAQAFEVALAANPDDLAGWCAYADYLVEQDDPRGEFMQVQIALEDDATPRDDRDDLKEREAALLAAHQREWLGELAPHLLDRDERGDHDRPAVEFWWARGFLSEMRVQYFTVPLARAVADTPAARFLRKLHIESTSGFAQVQAGQPGQGNLLDYLAMPAANPDDLDAEPAPIPPPPPAASRGGPYLGLIGAPWLRSLRVFQVGADAESDLDGWTEPTTQAPGVEQLVAQMPRVEELYLLCNGYNVQSLVSLPNLTRLQVLRLYGLWSEVPLAALARNPALESLTHLLVHPHFGASESLLPLSQVRALVNSPHLTNLSHLQLRLSSMGDEGVRAFIESGILKRLGWLDLRNGSITDAGARLFAEYGPAKNLRRLDLSRNQVTNAGLSLLRRAGVNAVVDNSLSRREREALDAQARALGGGNYDPDDPDGNGDYDME